MNKAYQVYKEAIGTRALPLAYVDMDLLDRNIEAIAKRAGKFPVRVATKSIRSISILQYIQQKNPAVYKGLMCFYPSEAAALCEKGFDDLLIAYPYTRAEELRPLLPWINQGKKIYLMVDHKTQLNLISEFAVRNNIKLNLCLDVDMTTTHLGIYFGVYRSSIHSIEDAKKFWSELIKYPNLQLKGLMGYEAQIAGVGDNDKTNKLMSLIIRLLKKLSNKILIQRRENIVQFLKDQGVTFDFVNGGGTGSLESSGTDHSLTELTAGSGFYAPTLFDHYVQFKHMPAAGFALEVTRNSHPGVYTLAGGGYVASGAAGVGKVPSPYLPAGMTLIKDEMCGEVQTPVRYNGSDDFSVGSPVFFRHAKAGELCERFNQLHLIRNGKITETVKTYRGEGWCFV